MEIIKLALLAVLIPAALSAVILLGAWRPWKRRGRLPDGRWGGGIALAAAYAAGHAVIAGVPPFPPVDVTNWPFYFGIGAAGLGVVGVWRCGGMVRQVGRGGAALLVAWLLLRPLAAAGWSAAEGWMWIPGTAAVLLGVCASTAALAERSSGSGLGLTLFIVAAGTGAVLYYSGTASLAQGAGALASGLFVCFLIGLGCPRFSLARGAAPVAAVLLVSLWTCGYFYTEDMPAASAAALAAAPSVAWIGRWPALRRRSRRGAAVVQQLAVVAAVAIAVWMACRNDAIEESDPYSGWQASARSRLDGWKVDTPRLCSQSKYTGETPMLPTR